MKEFFRFLRGELNGFYIQALSTVHILMSERFKDYLNYFHNQQFEKGKIDIDFLSGIGTFAGIFLPRLTVAESRTSLRMSDSKIKNGEEVSERGLFDNEFENFNFDYSDTEGDINAHATEALRSSLVGDEVPEGYISSEETDVLDDNGLVKPSAILPVPPADVAYSEFYGNQFLFLSEGESTYEKMSSDLLLELFKTMQKARYNGQTLDCLIDIIKTICPMDMMKVRSIDWSGAVCYVTVVLDLDVEISLKQQRVSLLTYVLSQKFPHVSLIEYN